MSHHTGHDGAFSTQGEQGKVFNSFTCSNPKLILKSPILISQPNSIPPLLLGTEGRGKQRITGDTHADPPPPTHMLRDSQCFCTVGELVCTGEMLFGLRAEVILRYTGEEDVLVGANNRMPVKKASYHPGESNKKQAMPAQ